MHRHLRRCGALGHLRLEAKSGRRFQSSSASGLREVILTFSGKVPTSLSSKIWIHAANVMKKAGGNIQDAGGTFVRMPPDSRSRTSRTAFSVSAFGAHISPSPVAGMNESQGDGDMLGCTLYMKATIPDSGIADMMHLLQKESPLQVYTLFLGTKSYQKMTLPDPALHPEAVSVTSDSEAVAEVLAGRRQTGALYLFGVDRPGQLVHITSTLSRFGVTIVHLRVQSGRADIEECDFVASAGGPLAENRMEIMFDEALMTESHEESLRAEIQRVGKQVGYAVTCIMADSQAGPQGGTIPFLPSYLLKRKAFAMTYLDAVRVPRRPPGASIGLAHLRFCGATARGARRSALSAVRAAYRYSPARCRGELNRRRVPSRSSTAADSWRTWRRRPSETSPQVEPSILRAVPARPAGREVAEIAPLDI